MNEAKFKLTPENKKGSHAVDLGQPERVVREWKFGHHDPPAQIQTEHRAKPPALENLRGVGG